MWCGCFDPASRASAGTGIAILSYADDLVFGINADFDAAPDVDELASGIERAVASLVTLSEARRCSNCKATLSVVQNGEAGHKCPIGPALIWKPTSSAAPRLRCNVLRSGFYRGSRRSGVRDTRSHAGQEF